MWRGSHLIKLVQAVQSLKRVGMRDGGGGGGRTGEKKLHLRPWKWANYQIQIN